MNFNNIPPVTLRLIILNVLVFVFTGFISPGLQSLFALHYFESEAFQPYQLATHMFTHGGFMHIAFNMYGVFLFGSMLERIWGPQKYLIFYFVSGLGAIVLHQAVDYFTISNLVATLDPAVISEVKENGLDLILSNRQYTNPTVAEYNSLLNSRMVGASGALFGLLVGFAMYFPNTELMLMFLPVPIKAKYFVIGYAAIELFLGLNNFQGDNIAHFAHLGGALFGFILIMIWKRDRSTFY